MYKPRINEVHNYGSMSRIEGDSGRLYLTPDGDKLPSVTTILSTVCKNEAIQKWREWVGEDVANEITMEAASIGTFMHENLENRLIGKPDHEGGMPMRVMGRKLADCIQHNAWKDIDEVWGQEVPLYYQGLWAGTTDLVGIHKGIPTIMDYKNAKRKKTWDMIYTYRMQCVAYALAHNQMFGTDIQRGAIFIAVRTNPPTYQEYIIEGDDFEEAKQEWINIVHKYYESL